MLGKKGCISNIWHVTNVYPRVSFICGEFIIVPRPKNQSKNVPPFPSSRPVMKTSLSIKSPSLSDRLSPYPSAAARRSGQRRNRTHNPKNDSFAPRVSPVSDFRVICSKSNLEMCLASHLEGNNPHLFSSVFCS